MQLPLELIDYVYELFPCKDYQQRNLKFKLIVGTNLGQASQKQYKLAGKHVNLICFYGSKNAALIGCLVELGRLDCVKYLYFEGYEPFSRDSMNMAARYGHLDLVQFMHENRPKGITTRAMDLAAQFGHLEVVKWLHYNRREGCTKKAMDGAIINGHLEVVKFLHQNRTEGYTMSEGDNLSDILAWLKSRPKGHLSLSDS